MDMYRRWNQQQILRDVQLVLLSQVKMEQTLSSPPLATNDPDGAYAQVITQEDLRGMA